MLCILCFSSLSIEECHNILPYKYHNYLIATEPKINFIFTRNVLDSLQGKKNIAIEEGPMAGWLYRNLKERVEVFIVSEPRRNKLITSEGDKDDKIDAGKLAALLRGNFLKAVHHLPIFGN